MKIPKKVKVGGQSYMIKEAKKLLKDKTINGVFDPRKQEITLKKKLNPEFREKVFLHELIHAIFDHCSLKQEEDKVELISTALYMVIKDNPDIFK